MPISAEDLRRLLEIDSQTKRPAENQPKRRPEKQTKMRASRARAFVSYLVAICIGIAGTLAWQSYGEATKQIVAATALDLGWSPEAKQLIASWIEQVGWTKPPAGPESAAVQPSVPEPQVATVAQTVPAAVVPKAPTDPVQVQQIVESLAALQESVQHGQESLAALAQTVDQLAASQDQMVRQIDMLQASNQGILEKTPAPLPPTVARTQKSTTRTPAVVTGANRKTLFNLINRGSQLNH